MIQSFAAIIYGFLYLFLKISDQDTFPPPLPAEEEKECFRLMKEGDREARQKLIKHNPETLAEASRIPGVSPSDINVLLVLLNR